MVWFSSCSNDRWESLGKFLSIWSSVWNFQSLNICMERETCLPFFSLSWKAQKFPCCVLHCLSRLSPISRQEKMMYHLFFLRPSPKYTLQGRERSNLLWPFPILYLKEKFLNPSPVSFQKAFIRHNLKRKLVGNCWKGLFGGKCNQR